MKTRKLFYSFILVSFALIIPVPLVDGVYSLFSGLPEAPATAGYPLKEVVVGLLSESIRALITCYLYSKTTDKGSTLRHGITLGLLYSALIASLYILLGGFYFKLENPLHFVVMDSIILAIQGVTSGIALYYVYRRNKILLIY